MESKTIKSLRKSIPLRTRLKVVNEMLIKLYLIDNGYIPDGFWTDEKEEKYGKSIRTFAEKMADVSIEDFNEWEKDGRPSGIKDKNENPEYILPMECLFFAESQGHNNCVNPKIESKGCIGIDCGCFEKK